MTVMMHGEAPLSVTAVAQTNKPAEYPKVDDDATIILRYPQAAGGADAVVGLAVRTQGYGGVRHERLRDRRRSDDGDDTLRGEEQTGDGDDHGAAGAIELAGVSGGDRARAIDGTHDLSALDTKIATMQILDAAKRSVKEGRTVVVTPVAK